MKIKFSPRCEFAEQILDIPKPANHFIPDWYKKAPRFTDNKYNKPEIPDEGGSVNNVTIKSCSPFLDALTYGYIFSAPLDIQVRNRDGFYSFNWRTEHNFVTDHFYTQHVGLPVPANYKDFVMKWTFDFIIQTPKGWSTFFTHPLNRNDLPFTTFSGIVETDRGYGDAVQFPFQMKEIPNNDTIIIEKGTPLCQFFPIKKETWKSERGKYDKIKVDKDYFNFKGKIVNSYKKTFWEKKVFK
jgi:hypothetical protein